MATTTTKLGLTKPATSDAVDITVLNANSDKIDAAVGLYVCTSTSRPSTTWNGLTIYETDTHKLYIYLTSSSSWVLLPDPTTFTFTASQLTDPQNLNITKIDSHKITVSATAPTSPATGDLWDDIS